MSNHMGTRWRGQIPIPRKANPLVRQFIARANRQMTTLSEIAEESGVARDTMSDWRYRSCPKLNNFEAALNVLGYRLAIVPLAPEDQ